MKLVCTNIHAYLSIEISCIVSSDCFLQLSVFFDVSDLYLCSQ